MEDIRRITVAIAVYNVQPYLRHCLDSVTAQTEPDFDILAVDDGSTDGSGEILAEYAARDPRIRVVHQPNGGLSVARNTAIDACKTGWIWFIDGDDAIEGNAVETWMGVKGDGMDILVSGHFKGVNPGGVTEMDAPQRALAVKRMLCMLPADQDPYGLSKGRWASVWIRLYSVPFLRAKGLRFLPGLNKSQDVLFNFTAHAAAERVGLVEAMPYVYLPHEGSSVTKRMSRKIPGYVIMLVNALEAEVQKLASPGLEEAWANNVLLQIIVAIELCYGHPENKDPYAKRLAAFRTFLDTPSIRHGLSAMGSIDEVTARLVYPAVKRGNLGLAAFILNANKRLRAAAKKLLRR